MKPSIKLEKITNCLRIKNISWFIGLFLAISSGLSQAQFLPAIDYSFLYVVPGVPVSINAPSTYTHPTTGAWTVSWVAADSGFVSRYELAERVNDGDEVTRYSGTALSFAVSGKTISGPHGYRVRACSLGGCSAYSAIKTVNLIIGNASTLALSTTASTTGSYTVSWPSKVSFLSATLQQRFNSSAYAGARDAKAYSNMVYSGNPTGTYYYRIHSCTQPYYLNLGMFGSVNIPSMCNYELPKSVVVNRPVPPAVPASIVTPSTNANGSHTISWGVASGTVTSYRLEQRKNGGSWSQIYSGAGRSKTVVNLGDGSYQYKIRACNTVCGNYRLSGNTIVARVPGVPSSLTTPSNDNNGTFTLSWGASPGTVDAYHLYQRINNGSWAQIYTGTAGSFTVSGLSDGSYSFQVRARNSFSTYSAYSGYRTAGTTLVANKPGTPSSIVTPATDNNGGFTVSWGASSGSVDAYHLYQQANGGSWVQIYTGTSRSFAVSGLGDGSYSFRVRARNTHSTYSVYSAYRTAGSSVVANLPSVPESITAPSSDVDGAFNVTWGAASGNVDQYQLYQQKNGGSWTSIYSGSGLAKMVSSLEDGSYKYRVRACNTHNTYTVCSNYRTLATASKVLHIPGTPTSISVPADSDGRFTLTVVYGSGLTTAYKIQHSVNGGASWVNKETGNSKLTLISLTRAAYDGNGNVQESYRFRIAACNLSGCSAYSAASNTINVKPPGTPASITLSNVSHQSADADGNYRLNWSVVNVSGVSYTVQEKIGNASWSDIATAVTATNKDIQRSSQNDYSYRVKACLTGVGCGNTTNPVAVKVAFKPASPTMPTISSGHSSIVANTSINGNYSVQWLKPAGTVSHYRIYKDGSVLTASTTATSKQFTEQANGTPVYQLQACNDVVCSTKSAGRSIQLLRTPGTPGAIQGPLNSDGSGSFNLSWPAASGSVARYEINRSSQGWFDNGPSSTLAQTNLADGNYLYQIRACNSLSCSSASVGKNVAVYNTPGVAGAINGPASSLNGSFNLSWGAATGNVTNYVLEQQMDAGAWETIQSSLAMSIALNGLSNADYRFKVKACNGPSCSNYTVEHVVDVVVPPTVTANPLDSVSAYALPIGDADVGATGGSHEVGADGSASYAINIPATAGRGGLSPDVSLAYNSNGGNSELGVGWSISGLPSIHRCGTNYALDGFVDGVDFDNNDQLCLDGQRLVAISGSYGASGTRYRSLQESYADIVSLNAEGSLASTDSAGTADAFKVRVRDGRTLFFGSTPESRLSRVLTTYGCASYIGLPLWGGSLCNSPTTSTSASTYQWMLTRIEDRQGNSVHYHYENNDATGEQRIDQITYNDDLHSIDFEWEPRPDTSQAYFAGGLVAQSQRLKSVTSYSDTTALRSLTIGYSTAGSTGDSKITSIEECANGDCLQPTTFDWALGEAGYSLETTGISNYTYNESRSPWVVDINGDGFDDIITPTFSTWKVALGGTNSLTDWHDTGVAISADDRRYALTLSYNNDTRDDILLPRSGYWYVLQAKIDTAGFELMENTGIPSTGYNHQPKIIDMDGDGRGDLLYRGSNGNWNYRLMTSTGFGSAIDTSAAAHGDEARTFAFSIDYNSDGLQDLLVPRGPYYLAYLSSGSGYEVKQTKISTNGYKESPRTLDLNGDGLSDIVFRNTSGKIEYAINKGNEFSYRLPAAGITATVAQWKVAKVLDYNSDGRSDIWVKNQLVSMADGVVTAQSSATYLGGTLNTFSQHAVVLDFNGDSLDDVVVLNNGVGTVRQYKHKGKRPDYLDTITNGMGVATRFHYLSIQTGSDLQLNPNADFYEKEGESSYPLLAESSAAYVVSELTQSDGLGGEHSSRYRYRGLRTHVGGYGSLGFSRVITENSLTGIRSEVNYSQDYSQNLQGSAERIESFASSGSTLSLTVNNWSRKLLAPMASGINGKRFRLELDNTTTTKKDLNGAFLSHETNDYLYDSYGSVAKITSKVYDGDSSGSLLRTTITDNIWQNDSDNWLIGLLQEAEVSVTDHSQNAPVHKRLSLFDYHLITGEKLSESILNPADRQPLHTTIYAPNEDRDSFGHIQSIRTEGPDFAARTQSMLYNPDNGLHIVEKTNAIGQTAHYSYYGTSDFSTGAYPGKLKTATAINGLKTHYQYDAFGRSTAVTTAYGTAAANTSATVYKWCNVGCRVNAKYAIIQLAEGGSPLETQIDQLGRTVRKRHAGMDGRYVQVDYDYDQLGHNTRVSEPYFEYDAALWSTLEYDALSRVIATVEPSGRRDTVSYNGLTMVSNIDVNGKNQHKIEAKDSLGHLLSVTDNAGSVVAYRYDSAGQQTEVSTAGSLDISINYDALGRKKQMTDPDKGAWQYSYNGLGQLISQTNAKGESTCMAYDLLGRMVKRIDSYTGQVATGLGQNAEANQQCAGSGVISQWVYHSSGNGLGQLDLVTSPNYAEDFTYDNYGRVTATTTTINNDSVVVNTSYDILSRPATISYPASSGAHNRLVVKPRYNALGYNTGTYSPDGSVLYARPEAVDARGNITHRYLGNGVNTARWYDASTGYLERIESYHVTDIITGSTGLQTIEVEFDLVGNLKSRSDGATGFSERYQYDALNRLTDAWSDFDQLAGNGEQHTEVLYSALGNIQEKSLVGNYSYGASCNGILAGPHALSSITPRAGESGKTATYCYDANGNMLTGDGRSLSYTSFDKPATITKGAANATHMRYGAARQLTWRHDINGSDESQTTLLGGGLYERIHHIAGAKQGLVEERHYVGPAIVTYSHDVNGNSSVHPTEERTRYTHTDHIGSVVAITDEIGRVEERMSFDAWGKRRAATPFDIDRLLTGANNLFNFGANPLELQSAFTNKGFTGHQQLDGVGIIHMGGRTYDAELGRFMQADPFVQDRTNLQGLNRYSYVENNPLSYTDPSGYFLKKLFKKAKQLYELKANPVKAHQQHHRNMKRTARFLNKNPELQAVVTVVATIACWNPGCGAYVVAASAAATAARQYVAGAPLGDIFKGAVIAGITYYVGGQIMGGVPIADITMGQAAGMMVMAGVASRASGGKFIDGVKGAAIGMGIGAAINAGVTAYQNYQARLNYQGPQGFIKVPEASPAMDNVIGGMADAPASVEAIKASLPDATIAGKSVPTVDPNFTPDYSATSSGSVGESLSRGAGVTLEATATDLIAAGNARLNSALSSANQSLGRAAATVQLACPMCAPVTAPVGAFSAGIQMMEQMSASPGVSAMYGPAIKTGLQAVGVHPYLADKAGNVTGVMSSY